MVVWHVIAVAVVVLTAEPPGSKPPTNGFPLKKTREIHSSVPFLARALLAPHRFSAGSGSLPRLVQAIQEQKQTLRGALVGSLHELHHRIAGVRDQVLNVGVLCKNIFKKGGVWLSPMKKTKPEVFMALRISIYMYIYGAFKKVGMYVHQPLAKALPVEIIAIRVEV